MKYLQSIFLVFLFLGQSAFGTSSSESSQTFVNISKKMLPTVVNIFTTSTVKMPWGNQDGRGAPDDLWRKFFEEFFGEPFSEGVPGGPGGNGRPAPKAMSLGSGFVLEKISGGALVLTNNHVIEGADEIKVKFTEESEEKESDAEIVGRDPDLDIALLKVKTKRKVEAVALGDSDKLEVGEWIAAVGNPFGHGHSVSHGIVSTKERSLPGSFANFLQVDAPINPGNSGGPLVNLSSEVVGINNAIDARGPGIGFAIPINLVKAVLPQLKDKGHVERGYIGINIDELRPDLAKQLKLDDNQKGPIVTNVIPGEPADKAGIKAYDVITEVNGKRVRNPAELVAAITNVPVASKAKILAIRSGKEKSFDVLVGKRPDSRQAKKGEGLGKGRKKPGKRSVDTGMVLEQIDADAAKELGLKPGFEGVVVAQVTPGGAAFQAGLRRGDVILEVDRKVIKSEDDFYKVVTSKKTYLVRVRRVTDSGQEIFAVVTLKLSSSAEQED